VLLSDWRSRDRPRLAVITPEGHELSHGTSIRKLWPGDVQGPVGMRTASWPRIRIEAALALTTVLPKSRTLR
jgi:hypothetical protein